MSILVNKNSKILVQGVTGTQASFHVKRSMDGGTSIIAGTSPNHGGQRYLGLPVYNNVAEAIKENDIDASVIFVPAKAVKVAVKEAVEAQIKLVVAITEGVPVHDMLEIKAILKGSQTMMIGPNTPGVITPQEARLGIFPENIFKKGNVGIISRASTLTYEAVLETRAAGLGQSTVIGLGDDMIIGSDYCSMMQKFMDDEETKAIVLIGKADNLYEQAAAKYYADLSVKKPVIAFVAGASGSYGMTMGYAVDIITRGMSSVADKKHIMRESGMIVVDRMSKLHEALAELNIK